MKRAVRKRRKSFAKIVSPHGYDGDAERRRFYRGPGEIRPVVPRQRSSSVFFLIRCAFWLTIVFMAMPPVIDAAHPTPRPLGASLSENGLAMLGVAKDAAVDQAKAWCATKPDRCLADAARLTALVSANQAEDTIEAPRFQAPEPSVEMSVPVPLADPRRHGQGSRSPS